MTAIKQAFEAAFRDYVVSGVSASGEHNPIKSDIRNLGGLIADALTEAVGFNEEPVTPTPENITDALNNLVRTGKTGIYDTAAHLPDHRAGILTYRKMVGGQAELLTDLTRFYPAGAFLSPTVETPTFVKLSISTWVTTGNADVHRGRFDGWMGPHPSLNSASFNAKIIDPATGRIFAHSRGLTGAYSGSVYWNAAADQVIIDIRMPAGVAPPPLLDVYIAIYHGPAEAIFVDPIAGSNFNDGRSWEWAVATFPEALTRSPKVIFCKPGVYDLGNYIGAYSGSDLSIQCIGGRAIFVPRPFAFSAWVLDIGNTYVSTVAGSPTPVGVVDLDGVDQFGDPVGLTKAATLAACRDAAGSWFYDAAGPRKIYVNLGADRVPSTQVMPFGSANILRHSAAGAKVHVSDAVFVNGTGGALSAREADTDAVLIAERCSAIGSYNTNAVSIQGIGLAILIHCRANFSANDGFNYTQGAEGISPHFIEIGCVGYGNYGGGTGNGSTSHNHVRGFRINCDYKANTGPNVADVNDAKTVNVNVTATGAGAWGFVAEGNAVQVIDGGAAFDNGDVDFHSFGGPAAIKVRDAYGRTQSGLILALAEEDHV